MTGERSGGNYQLGGGAPSPERIRELLKSTLGATPWARDMFGRAGKLQKAFFLHTLRADVDASQAAGMYDTVLHQLSDLTRAQIKYGYEHVWALKDSPAVIVASNHLGIGQVGYVDNSDGSFSFPGSELEAFPLGMLPGFTISQLYHGKRQTDIFGEDQGDLDVIRRKLSLVMSGIQGNRTESLAASIDGLTEGGGRHVFQFFPEGHTTGWMNEGGPYDLEPFRSGTFVIGCKTGLPILPICQYFDPDRGLDLIALPPMRLGEEDLPNIGAIKDATREAMQIALTCAMTGEQQPYPNFSTY